MNEHDVGSFQMSQKDRHFVECKPLRDGSIDRFVV